MSNLWMIFEVTGLISVNSAIEVFPNLNLTKKQVLNF
ncbi:Mid2-like cell wall stress sensor domain protein, partial [Staphylococcus epidermidis]|nr:Mid2-like cell wall stress sensor domain protein [Staphylococcus epidermidis]